MTKTIYISGPITDLTTGQPRKGWQQDFLDAEAKLRRMGFAVINPVDIAREVEEANKWQWECTFHPCTSTGEPIPPSHADYIMACLQRIKLNQTYDRLHGIYVIGDNSWDALDSHGVRMELLMADILGLPVYAKSLEDLRVDSTLVPIDGYGTIEELLND